MKPEVVTPFPARGIPDDKVIVNGKALTIAVAVEVVIIAIVLFAGIQFANRFGYAEVGEASVNLPFYGAVPLTWLMAIAGTLLFAAAETCRVPLALAAFGHRDRLPRIFAMIGVLCMVGVTTKSVSQVAEQMYAPRLREVVAAKHQLRLAKADKEAADLEVAAPQRNSAAATSRIDQLNTTITTLSDNLKQLGPPPAPRRELVRAAHRNRHGQLVPAQYRYVTQAWAGAKLSAQIEELRAELSRLMSTASDADTAVNSAQTTAIAAERVVADREAAYSTAVMHSQLHSFTAMVYGIDPIEVTDGQVHAFMRFFVFVAAFAVASGATLLACTAVTRPRSSTPKPVVKAPPDKPVTHEVKLVGTLADHVARLNRATR